jgi:sugar phosphate permease
VVAADGPLATVEMRPPPLASGVLTLLRTPSFLMVCAVGMLVAFALGAFNHWLPLYLERVKHFSTAEAGFWVGSLSASAGLLGVLAGGLIGDALFRRTRAGHILTIAGGFMLSAPLGLLFLLSQNRTVFLPAFFFAVFFLLLYTGSVNAVIHNVVQPTVRATAVAIFVFVISVGGAAPSPFIVGLISGRRSLQGAMLLLPFIIFFAGLIALAAATVVAADMRRVERSLPVVRSQESSHG